MNKQEELIIDKFNPYITMMKESRKSKLPKKK